MSFELTNFFPVYDLLYSQISTLPNKDNPLTDDEIKGLVNNILKMDKLGSDMIYIWIRIHSLRHSNSRLLDVPYNGEKLDSKINESDIISDVKFDVRNFPPVLCRMLIRFTDLHLRKINEEIIRNNDTK